jgi:site-specific DNA-methyltransferase (adenine-specific)
MKVVHVLRKPCSREAGTVASNVLKYGTGALNIDATRVAHDASVDMNAVQRQQATGGNSSVKGAFGAEALVGKEIAMYKPGGRWPANLVLQHLDGCSQEGAKEIRVVGCTATTPHTDRGMMPNGSERTSMAHYATKGRETVAAWTCAPGCPVAALDAQSGVSKSTGGCIGNAQGVYAHQGCTGWGAGHTAGDPGFGDVGGASRFFKQVKA